MLHLVTLPLGEERYGLEVTAVREVQPLRAQMWSPVPCTPGFVVGAVNVRGRIYSLIDVARFLGLPARSLAETTHVLLVEAGQPGSEAEMVVGILADDVPQAVRVPRADVQPAAATISARAQDYVRGVTAGHADRSGPGALALRSGPRRSGRSVTMPDAGARIAPASRESNSGKEVDR